MHSTNNYTVQANIIKIGDKELFFKYNINDILEVFNMLIVRLDSPQGIVFNENVFGVSVAKKEITWQIAKLNYDREVNCPFVGMKLYNNHLYLNNWCDIYLIVDPLTGEIFEKGSPEKR